MKYMIPVMLLITALISSCAPTLYFIDRQTVMEMESAGEWPEFDKEFFLETIKVGTTDFVTIPNNEQRKRMYSILNGEFVTRKD